MGIAKSQTMSISQMVPPGFRHTGPNGLSIHKKRLSSQVRVAYHDHMHAAHFAQANWKRKEVIHGEEQEEGYPNSICQAAGSEVLGNDAGC
jgi:hypothetical protein